MINNKRLLKILLVFGQRKVLRSFIYYNNRDRHIKRLKYNKTASNQKLELIRKFREKIQEMEEQIDSLGPEFELKKSKDNFSKNIHNFRFKLIDFKDDINFLKKYLDEDNDDLNDILVKINSINHIINSFGDNFLNNKDLFEFKLSMNKLSSWAKKVKEIGKCDLCKSKKDLTAHHVYSKSLHISLAYDLSNGKCLCIKCHTAYHKKYSLNIEVNPFTYKEFYDKCKIHLGKYGYINYDKILEEDWKIFFFFISLTISIKYLYCKKQK